MIMWQVELAKIELSGAAEATVAVPALAGGAGLERRITRAAAEAVWAELFERAVWPVEQVATPSLPLLLSLSRYILPSLLS